MAPVMASKPVANTITSTSMVRLPVLMPVAVIAVIGSCRRSTSADVGPVVGRVVVGIEAGPLGAERVVVGHQCRGNLGVLHHGADLLADQLADRARCRRNRRPGRPRVAVRMQTRSPAAQRLLEPLAAFGIAQAASSPPSLCGWRHAGQRQARLLAIGGAISLEVGRRDRPAPDRYARAARSSACAGTRSDAPPVPRSAGSTGCPDDPVPITATRLPVSLTPSCGQRPVK